MDPSRRRTAYATAYDPGAGNCLAGAGVAVGPPTEERYFS